MLSGFDVVPVPHASATTSPAVSRYGDYLEGVYSRTSVSSDGKFPPTPSKTYVNLAVVKRASQIRDLEELRKNVLHGRVDEILEGKTKIELTGILKPQENGSPISLVFVEGPPGIGKSTLAWELCRKWDRKQYDLAVLLRLREREVQQIEKVAGLFPHGDEQLQQLVAKEVLGRDGKRVLFILDGYDELPINLRHQGLLIKLLKGEALPECSVLVTSRPSASRDLFKACRPQIQRHVEILGFTQESVKDYAHSIFSSEPEVLKDFLVYISASQNPAINSSMYIPLNAAIIVEIYKNSRRKGCPIPKTMTQVYTQLCLTLLQRYLDSVNPQNTIVLDIFSDLPDTYYDQFSNLSRLAFKQFQQHKIVFYSDSVPKEMVHFGFLDSVPALYGGGRASYNFLHFTLQEFLVAYHITELSNGIDIFERHSKDSRWEVVWRFVSGLTRFKYFENNLQNLYCSCLFHPKECLEVTKLFLHCLFEGQLKDTFDFVKATGRKLVSYTHHSSTSPLDRYALGYCIVNCSPIISWKVTIFDDSDESFIWGLNSNHNGNGIISHLKIVSAVKQACLDSYPMKILHGIERLSLGLDLFDKTPMNNLTSLSRLDIQQSGLDQDHGNDTLLPAFSNLIHSSKLTCLSIDGNGSLPITNPLGEILFGPSSLSDLTISGGEFENHCFDLLETNTCLSRLSLNGNIEGPPFQTLYKILRNKTMQKLRIDFRSIGVVDLELVDSFKAALSSNTSLEHLKLAVSKYYYHNLHWLRAADPRVTVSER